MKIKSYIKSILRQFEQKFKRFVEILFFDKPNRQFPHFDGRLSKVVFVRWDGKLGD